MGNQADTSPHIARLTVDRTIQQNRLAESPPNAARNLLFRSVD
jgi:hypothetical protein